MDGTGLKVLHAARHNDEVTGVLAVVTKPPSVVVGLLAVALGLHVYGSVI